MSNRWSVEQYAEYKRTGKMPEKHLDVCPGCGGPADNGHDRCSPPSPYYCKACTFKGISEMKGGTAPERTVKSIDAGRHHRKIVKDPNVGVSFSSLTEARRYDFLMAQPEVIWVDVHPVFELGHGLRYCADFLVHIGKLGGFDHRVEDVKSTRSLTTSFKRTKKLFDSSHPFAPLVVVQYLNGEWVETR